MENTNNATTGAQVEKIKESAHWSTQWNNYRADSDDAIQELNDMGFMVDGKGEDTGLVAMTGFYQDDSGYRSRNLDYAKSYSGYKAQTARITRICLDDVDSALRAERQEIEKCAEQIEKLTNTNFQFYLQKYMDMAIAREPTEQYSIKPISGRKYHYEYRWKKYETYDAALLEFKKEKDNDVLDFQKQKTQAEEEFKIRTSDSLTFWGERKKTHSDNLLKIQSGLEATNNF